MPARGESRAAGAIRMRLHLTIASVTLCAACAAAAAPRTPASAAEVLEHVPARASNRALSEAYVLRERLARDPHDGAAAVRLASLYIAQSRAESDPRPLGRAQAVLAPWWKVRDAPVPILVLRATIRQSQHEFEPARTDLHRAVALDPRDAQAWLTLATIEQVTGDFAAARASCERVQRLAPLLVGTACLAAVDGVNGRAAQALSSLDEAMRRSPSAPASLLGWARTIEAEIATRAGDAVRAERAYREALSLDASDAYARAAYGDFLLDRGRASEVLALIPADTPIDPLLLRRTIAAQRAGSPEADGCARDMAARIEAARLRGDRVHLREEARFALEVRRDPAAALVLALDNWRVQKEPADARIALEAAAAARDPAAVRGIVDWLDGTRLESVVLSRLVVSLRRA